MVGMGEADEDGGVAVNMFLTAEQQEQARKERLFVDAWIRMFEREERLHKERVRAVQGSIYDGLFPTLSTSPHDKRSRNKEAP